MLFRFCLYGFLKNQRYFEPFFMLALLAKDLSFFWIGVLIACQSLTLNLLEIPSGFIADYWGRRRCMIASFVAYLFSYLFFAFANEFPWLVLAMVLLGVGDSFRTGTHKAMIFHWLRMQGRESERTQVYGLTRSWSQYGSALSAVLAAIFLLTTRDFQSVFLLAAIPCVLNIINFLGYPKFLDGEVEVSKTLSWQAWRPFQALRNGLVAALSKLELRRLIMESMAWEGVFSAIQDYLQPALLLLILSQLSPSLGSNDLSLDATHFDSTAVITISAVYTVLFFLSGWASRTAHLVVRAAGSASTAAVRLWYVNLGLYLTMLVACAIGSQLLVVLAFALLAILQNVWRPILVSRIDEVGDSAFGATVLSVESQAQRVVTLLLAPTLGWAIDSATSLSPACPFWPIGLIGTLAAGWALATRKNP